MTVRTRRHLSRPPVTRGVLRWLPTWRMHSRRNDDEYLFRSPVNAVRLLEGYIWALKAAGEPVPADVCARLAYHRAQLSGETR